MNMDFKKNWYWKKELDEIIQIDGIWNQ